MAETNIRNLRITQDESWYEQLYLPIKMTRFPKVNVHTNLVSIFKESEMKC